MHAADDYRTALVGRSILKVRKMEPDELDAFGWDDYQHTAVVIILDNGKAIVPSCDPEGNQAGFLFIEDTETVMS